MKEFESVAMEHVALAAASLRSATAWLSEADKNDEVAVLRKLSAEAELLLLSMEKLAGKKEPNYSKHEIDRLLVLSYQIRGEKKS